MIVVGAGYAGIACAAALLTQGVDVRVLDSADGPGGRWRRGGYDSLRLISSRTGSAYPGLPMPAGEPFPTGPEFAAYLAHAANVFGVDAVADYGQLVCSIDPDGDGWSVDGRRCAGLVLATGLHQIPVVPDLPGRFGGVALHTESYRNPADLAPGPVLVVGGGNSGCDVAVEAARSGHEVTLSVRRGHHLVPRMLLGRPASDLRPPPVPQQLSRIGTELLLRLLIGSNADYGLPEPDHRLFAEPPVVHDEIRGALTAGELQVAPGVARLTRGGVQFTDGTRLSVGTIVWATGYRSRRPISRALIDGMVDGMVDGAAGEPGGGPLALLGGVLSPLSPGLAVLGAQVPRGGAGEYLASGAAAIAEALALHVAGVPLVPLLGRFLHPDDRATLGVQEGMAGHRRLRAALPAVARLTRA